MSNMIMPSAIEVSRMEFLTARDLRTSKAWETVAKNGEAVLTNNGKPTILMLQIKDGEFEELAKAVRQTRAMRAFNAIRLEAAEVGYLTDEEIEAEIQAYRVERSEVAPR